MRKVNAIYNARNTDGSVSNTACSICDCIGAAYVKLDDYLVCKGCLDVWADLINKSILQDVMDSVQRRKGDSNV